MVEPADVVTVKIELGEVKQKHVVIQYQKINS